MLDKTLSGQEHLQLQTESLQSKNSPFYFIVEFLKAQWKKIKETMKRCLDKRNRLTRSGAARHALPKCKYFDSLLFIHDKISNHDTTSNIVIPSSPHETNFDIQSPMSSPISLTSPSTPNSNSSIRSTHNMGTVQKKRSHPDENSTRNVKCDRKKGQEVTQRLDVLTLDYLERAEKFQKQQLESSVAENNDENDSDLLFFKSLLSSMKSLTKRNNRIARKKIQDIIFELEMDELD